MAVRVERNNAIFQFISGGPSALSFLNGLHKDLKGRGVTAQKPEDIDQAFAMHCSLGERSFELRMTSLNSTENLWRLEVSSKRGFLSRLLGGGDADEHAHLLRCLHDLLRATATIQSLCWSSGPAVDRGMYENHPSPF